MTHHGATMRRALCLTIVVTVCVASAATPVAPQPAHAVELPVVIAGPDPALTEGLDRIIGVSPPDTCLAVNVEGVAVYDHRSDDLQIPASTQKILTASSALETLGAQHEYKTNAVTSAPVTDGVVRGDVVLVGGGDPALATSIAVALRRLPPERPITLLDGIAQQLIDQGITKIEGRIVGDDQRYDDLRTVPSWPERYVAQRQSGPLGALVVDGGYVIELKDGSVVRRRVADPAAASAQALTALLRAGGVEVAADGASGSAPADATELASVTSAPLGDLVEDFILRSDNQMAELVTKELGLATAMSGTTAAGAQEVASWLDRHDVAPEGAYVVDGSGLDRGNQTTCRGLVDALEVTGPEGPIAATLPVAGERGTLRGRFLTTHAVGTLRAKTGSLNSVTSLAGFVDLPEGATATFAYIVNGTPVDAKVLQAQDFLAEALATWKPTCPKGEAPPMLAPEATAAAASVALSAWPVAAALPAVAGTLAVVDSSSADLVDRCTRESSGTVEVGGSST